MAAVSIPDRASTARGRTLLLETGLADRALDEEVHCQLELVVVVGNDLALREDHGALVVLERSAVELEAVIDEALAELEDPGPQVLGDYLAERADGHHVLLEAAAEQVRLRPGRLPGLHDLAARRPVPLGAR